MQKIIEGYIVKWWNKHGWIAIFGGCVITLFIVWLIQEEKGSSDVQQHDFYEKFSPFPQGTQGTQATQEEFSNAEKEMQEKFYENQINENQSRDLTENKKIPLGDSNDSLMVMDHEEQHEFVWEGGASKGENICRRSMQELTGKEFAKIKPSFLKNPITGNFLEIDCYNQELKIGVEYNGEQHVRYIPHFHKSKEAFQLQLYRDYIKNQLCLKNKVLLITVPHTMKPEKIKEYLRKELKENNRL